jgi:hypothetical protein
VHRRRWRYAFGAASLRPGIEQLLDTCSTCQWSFTMIQPSEARDQELISQPATRRQL